MQGRDARVTTQVRAEGSVARSRVKRVGLKCVLSWFGFGASAASSGSPFMHAVHSYVPCVFVCCDPVVAFAFHRSFFAVTHVCRSFNELNVCVVRFLYSI